MPGRRTPNRRFFRPPSPPFQPRDFRFSPRELLARELAPDTVVAARPTGGRFGSQIRESVQERQHVLLRHGEKVGVLAFCHGLLKFEPQNARMTAKVTGAVLRQESGSARKGFCQERFLSGRNFVRKGFCQEAGSARKEFCQEGFLSGSGLCQEGILSARKEFCQEGFLSGSGLCQEGILSGRVFVRKRALPGRNFVRKGFCQEVGSARKGQSALELGVKLFVVVAVCFCFGAGGGASQLWSLV